MSLETLVEEGYANKDHSLRNINDITKDILNVKGKQSKLSQWFSVDFKDQKKFRVDNIITHDRRSLNYPKQINCVEQGFVKFALMFSGDIGIRF